MIFPLCSGMVAGPSCTLACGSYVFLSLQKQTPVVPEIDSEFMELLKKEQLARNFAFLGEEKMNLLNSSLVIGIGVGV